MNPTIRIDDSPYCAVNAWGGRARPIGGRRYAAIGRRAIELGPAAFLDTATREELGLDAWAREVIPSALPLSAVLYAIPRDASET